MRFLRRSLLAQLVTYFMLLSVAIVGLVGYIAFVQARNTLEQASFQQLEITATLKEDELNRWVSDQRESILLVASLPEAQAQAEQLLKSGSGAQYRDAYSALSEYLEKVVSRNQNFQEAFIIRTSDAQALLSTDKEREGTQHADAEYFIEGQWGPSIQSITISQETGRPSMTIATPLLNDVGLQLGGVLVVDLNLETMDKIILKRAGLGETGRTYLVDKTNILLSAEGFEDLILMKTVSSRGIDAAILGEDGSGLYQNYENTPVIGSYRWIGPWEVALLVEMDQQEAFEPATNLAQNILLIGFLSSIVLAVGVYLLARQITNPILTISNVATQISAGDLAQNVEVDRDDEVGVLAKAFNNMSTQLRDLISELEQRVAERTSQLENRANQFEAISNVARSTASIKNLNELLQSIAQLVIDRFGFYHTGIFIIDNNGEFAVLAASPTEAGKQMIANKHKLRVGEVGLVGRVASSGEPRISLDTGIDAVHFNNPLLPRTRSEMALPLKVENITIGVLDVQSDQPQAFNQEDIDTMQILADQLAIAIERTRLLQQLETSLSELEHSYARTTQEGWKSLAERGLISNFGYQFDNIRIQPLNDIPALGQKAIQDGIRVSEAGKSRQESIAIPIKLRGQSIGAVTVKLKEGHKQSTISTIEQAVERLASALENARLFEEARQRAEREQAISQVTTAISSAPEFDSILRTAVEEIGKSLGDSEVSIRIIENNE